MTQISMDEGKIYVRQKHTYSERKYMRILNFGGSISRERSMSLAVYFVSVGTKCK